MPDGPDACLGVIPGVAHACCGHGGLSQPYVVLGGEPDQGMTSVASAVTLRGDAALTFFALVREGEWSAFGREQPDR
jgi:hypothetical protein